jgi:hypothetical protein
MPWEKHRPYSCARCAFRASTCGIRTGSVSSAERSTLKPQEQESADPLLRLAHLTEWEAELI